MSFGYIAPRISIRIEIDLDIDIDLYIDIESPLMYKIPPTDVE